MPTATPPAPSQTPSDLRKQLSDARLSAIVEAAYILREASRLAPRSPPCAAPPRARRASARERCSC
jgi:hypothetical protein